MGQSRTSVSKRSKAIPNGNIFTYTLKKAKLGVWNTLKIRLYETWFVLKDLNENLFIQPTSWVTELYVIKQLNEK